MKKIRKQILSATLASAMLASVPYAQAVSPDTVTVSRQQIYFDGQPCSISAYAIDGSNYFMLRDLAALMNGSKAQFSVNASPADFVIQITSGGAYTPQGDEMSELNAKVTSIAPSQWKLSVGGKTANVAAYAIDGYNFFRLRDLGNAIGFSVGYNAETDSVSITSEAPAFSAEIPACPAVAPSWFDDAVFVGDSVSSWLSYYDGDKGLGKATFLSATSLGIENALRDVTSKSVHPSYQGTKMKIEEAVAKCGAKKVYVMLGMNDIGYGVERASGDYVKLLSQIQQASPGVQIYVQSVTPMIQGSKRADNAFNNLTVGQFNAAMKAHCQQNKWYYLDIASVYDDGNGFLRKDICSDAATMGLHISYAATADWVNYLRTHVPAI